MSKTSISDIVGALLKGLTVARIRSDLFSGGASAQYLTNPDLQSYPVPRVEIRSADIDMKFTILDTEDCKVDVHPITRAVLFDGLPALIDDILAANVKPAADAPAESAAPLGDHAGEQREAVKLGLSVRFESYFDEEIRDIHTQLMANPYCFAREVVEFEMRHCLPSVLEDNGITVWLDDPLFVRAVSDATERWSLAMHDAVYLAIELAKAERFDMDLGVKRDQFQYVPEHVISSLKLSLAIENYEWTLSQDKQGNTTKKLTRQ